MAAATVNILTFNTPPGWFLREPGNRPGGGDAKDLPGEKQGESAADDEPFIRCRHCLQHITRPSDRISRNGSHRHNFANPNGVVYEIGCFLTVVGCGAAGTPTFEFTWFSGYRWQIVYCSMCLTHLGWVFEGPGQDCFHGLILNHLTDPDE